MLKRNIADSSQPLKMTAFSRQYNINKIVKNFEQVKLNFEKLDGVISDLENCKSEYTKTVLISVVTKVAEQLGMKEKILG